MKLNEDAKAVLRDAGVSQAEAAPPGPYAGGGRSPIVWVYLCPVCGGYPPLTTGDYSGALSGRCQGCGSECREVHKFRAWIDSAPGCGCDRWHARRRGDLSRPAISEDERQMVMDPLDRFAPEGAAEEGSRT